MTSDEPERPSPDEGEDLDRALNRGALINAFGIVAKLSFPIFFLVVTWSLGAALTGVFSLAFFAGELLKSFVVSGYMDGVVIYTSRATQRPDEGIRPERVIGAAMSTTLLVSSMVAAALWWPVAWAVDAHFDGYAELLPALRLVLLTLPALAALNVALSGTKAKMVMHYEVLVNGLARPLLLTASALGAAFTDTGLTGLMVGYLATHVVLAALGVVALARLFDLRAVLRGMRTLRVPRLHGYSVPQSFKVTLSNYQTRVDAWLLGIFATPPTVLAMYTTAALVVDSLRQIRIVFSTSLGPVAARHHARGDNDALEAVLNRLCRWTTALVIPFVFTLVVFRGELLTAIDPAYDRDSTFMLVLLIAPLSSCALGLFGNTISYTGHSRWNLANALFVATTNTVISYALIPSYGLMGAAVGTAISTVALNLVEIVEMRALEGIGLRPRDVFHPYLATVPLVVAAVLLWDPGELPWARRLPLWVGGVLVYVAILRLARMPELLRRAE